jgi:hypothetical protein
VFFGYFIAAIYLREYCALQFSLLQHRMPSLEKSMETETVSSSVSETPGSSCALMDPQSLHLTCILTAHLGGDSVPVPIPIKENDSIVIRLLALSA